jgi:hypothetical protein
MMNATEKMTATEKKINCGLDTGAESVILISMDTMNTNQKRRMKMELTTKKTNRFVVALTLALVTGILYLTPATSKAAEGAAEGAEKRYHADLIRQGLASAETVDLADYCADVCSYLDIADGAVLVARVQENCDLCAAALSVALR